MVVAEDCFALQGTATLVLPRWSFVRLLQLYSHWVEYPEACFGLDGWEGEEWRVDTFISGTMYL